MNIQRLAKEINIVSIIAFGIQITLGIVPVIWLVISSINREVNPNALTPRGGNSFLGLLALVALIFSIVWWIPQYRLAKNLPDPERRPQRQNVEKSLQAGIVVNFMGMILVVLASLGYAWYLFVRVLTNPRGSVTLEPNALVPMPVFTQLDAVTILAIVHTIAAELVGIAGYSWLLHRVRTYHSDNASTYSNEYYNEEYAEP